MAIRFSSQSGNFDLHDTDKVVQWIRRVVSDRGFSVGNINYLFCDDEYMLTVNRQYLQHDTYTDIITFDYVSGGLVSGDILICVDRVGENAVNYGVPFGQELHRVIIHGVLHLLGQGDKSEQEAAEMRRLEAGALELWDQMFRVEQ